MNLPILIWSGSRGLGNSNYQEVSQCISIWNQRKSLLAKLGVDLKILVPEKSSRLVGDYPVIDHFEERDPELLVNLPGLIGEGMYMQEQRFEWPRDCFTSLRNAVLTKKVDLAYTTIIFSGFQRTFPIQTSPIGEGGYSISFDHTVVVSTKETKQEDLSLINAFGYKAHLMPALTTSTQTLNESSTSLYRRMSVNGHLDTEINVVDGRERSLFVNKEYYEVFQTETEKLAEKIGARINIIDNKLEIMRKAVNFITLPSGDLIVAEDNPEFVRRLSDLCGKDKVHPVKTFVGECTLSEGGGGLRCRTNLVYEN